MKYGIYKNRHLHIPKPYKEISDEESSHSAMSILVATHKTKGVSEEENRALQKKNGQSRRESQNHQIPGLEILTKKVMTLVYPYLLSRLLGNLKKD